MTNSRIREPISPSTGPTSLSANLPHISKWANSANFQPIKTRKKFFSDYSQSQLAFPPFLYVNRAFNIARVREKLSSNSRIKTMLENLPLSMTGILSMLELYNLWTGLINKYIYIDILLFYYMTHRASRTQITQSLYYCKKAVVLTIRSIPLFYFSRIFENQRIKVHLKSAPQRWHFGCVSRAWRQSGCDAEDDWRCFRYVWSTIVLNNC